MALINCNQCGKPISDTSSACIHCGASTQEPTIDEKESTEILEAADDGVVNFSDLDEETKAELQIEFWKADKSARSLIRRQINQPHYVFLFIVTTVIFRLLPHLQNWALENFFDGTVYSYELLAIADKFWYAFSFAWLVIVVFTVHNTFCFKSRLKRQLYHRKLQKWLLENKNIHFMPNFISNKDKEVFEKINLDD